MKAYRKKGLIHFGIKQYDKAETLFKKTIALDPENVQAYINLGMVEFSKRDKAEARRLWEYAIDIKSDDIKNVNSESKTTSNFDLETLYKPPQKAIVIKFQFFIKDLS